MEQSKGHPAWSTTPALIVAIEHGFTVINNVKYVEAMAMVMKLPVFIFKEATCLFLK
jgi:hypothetical protein